MTTPSGLPERSQAQPAAFYPQRVTEAMLFLVLGTFWITLGMIRGYGVQYLGIFGTVLFTVICFPRRKIHFKKSEVLPDVNHQRLLVVSVLSFVLVLVNSLVNHVRYSDWVMPLVIFLTGLYFLGASKTIPYKAYAVTGTLLMLGAAVYPFLSPAGPSCPSGCWGAGLCFWGSSLYGQYATHPRTS